MLACLPGLKQRTFSRLSVLCIVVVVVSTLVASNGLKQTFKHRSGSMSSPIVRVRCLVATDRRAFVLYTSP